MKNKVIISVAPIQPNTPIESDLLAEDIKQCVLEGASMCHLHCRKPDGSLTSDISFMSQCFDKILAKTDIVIQVSTGGVSNMDIKNRCRPLQYPNTETASLNAGSTNLGDSVYINTFEDITFCAKEIYRRKIIPDIEVFDIGMIHNINKISQFVPFRHPIFYNLVFGHQGGIQPTIDALIAFRSMVPKDALWGITHYGRQDWNFLAAAIAMGASEVRIGFEDSNYLSSNQSAKYNYELVKRLAHLIKAIGFSPATISETRILMGCFSKRKYK